MIVEEASTSRTAVRGPRLLMAAAIVVATAAGIVGAIMLIAPTSTGTYFAWPLGPPGLAALVGGFYVVSAPVFAYAGTRPAVEVRGLAAAVLAFTVPTLVATYLHRDIFDFSRLMAIAWVVLSGPLSAATAARERARATGFSASTGKGARAPGCCRRRNPSSSRSAAAGPRSRIGRGPRFPTQGSLRTGRLRC